MSSRTQRARAKVHVVRSILVSFILLASNQACTVIGDQNANGPVTALSDKAHCYVAVASSLLPVMEQIKSEFEQQYPEIELLLSSGSSGSLYAQIRAGAPYAVFLSADALYPVRLERDGYGVKGSRVTYAIGQLSLCGKNLGGKDPATTLKEHLTERIAIANPEVAPYGRAARQYLQQLGVWRQLTKRVVRANSVAQAYQLLRAGVVDLALVASSLPQFDQGRDQAGIECVQIEPELYDPIIQQLIILKSADRSHCGARLAKFMQTERVRSLLEAIGYRVP